jgi:tetratricopeptide (TPR) repeat protein
MNSFVGRERERAQLWAGWQGAREGRAYHVLLSGEAGIGKTRLVDELVDQVTRDGGRVMRGRCWDPGGTPAYWPWIQALAWYIDEVGEEPASRLLADLDPALVRLLPALRSRVPVPDDDGGAEASQLRLYQATPSLLQRLASDRPLLLVLDEMESADGPSLQLLRFVARARGDSPRMVVAVYRTPLPPGATTAAPLAALAREPGLELIALAGLAREEVGRLIEAMTGGPPPAGAAEALHARTGGNPLYTSEFLRLRSARGQADADVASAPLPSGVRGIIRQRLATLPAGCQQLLSLAAVLGKEFELDALAGLARQGSEALLDALAPAFAAGILVPSRDHPLGQTFSHPLVRDSLYEDLSPSTRGELHQRAAESLRARPSSGEEPLEAIAGHYLAAVPVGAGPQALEFCRRAARRANALAMRDEAVRWFQQAAALCDSGALGPTGSAALSADVLLELGDAQARAGWAEEAVATLEKVAERAERLGLPTHLARAALGLGGRFVWSRAVRGSTQNQLLEKALAGLPPDEISMRARLLARLAGLQRDLTSARQNVARCREAVALARRAGDLDALCLSLTALGLYEGTQGPTRRLLEIADELAAAARALGDLEREMQAHDFRAAGHIDDGDLAGAEEALGVSMRLAQQLAQPAQRWYAATVRAELTLLRGQLDRAEEQAAEARRIGERAHGNESRLCQLMQLCLIRREQGRAAEMLVVIDDLLTLLPVYGMILRCFRAWLALDCGRPDEARAFLDRQLQSGWADLQDLIIHRFMLALCAEMSLRLGHAEAAAALEPMLASVPKAHLVSAAAASAGSAARYRGLVAMALGRREDAVRLLRQAGSENRATGAAIWALRSDLDLARVLASRDDGSARAEAAGIVAAVAQEAELRGLVALVAETRALGQAGPPAPRSATPIDRGEAASFRREGELWTIDWGGRAIRLRDGKGLRYLAQLLARAGADVPAIDLVAFGEAASEPPDPAEADPGLAVVERARQSVTKAIKNAIRRIAREHQELGEHLQSTVHTGLVCRYAPDARQPPRWRVEG